MFESSKPEMKTPSNVSPSDRTDVGGAGRKNGKLRGKPILATSARVRHFLVWTLASHADEATNRVITVRVSSADKMSKAQLGPDGTIHLLFDSTDGPQYVSSDCTTSAAYGPDGKLALL